MKKPGKPPKATAKTSATSPKTAGVGTKKTATKKGAATKKPGQKKTNSLPKPFLKWAGGKRQLLDRLETRLPKKFNNYHEPFLGSGALFFHLHHKKLLKTGHLSDVNSDLIQTWLSIRNHVDDVIECLAIHKNDSSYYYEVRSQNPEDLSPPERAARLIFMNKTCYNGLYRVNSRGQFNVPFGRYANPKICDSENLRAVSKLLQTVELSCNDYMTVGEQAQPGDLVYFDPPYLPRSRTSYFTAYHSSPFMEEQQTSLRDLVKTLHEKGVHVMLSNSDTDFIVDLYEGFNTEIVRATRSINSNGKKRGKVSEVVVRTYDQ